MSPLVQKITEAPVETFPYPHLVVEDVLPGDLCESLLREMPPLEVLSGGEPLRSNFRFSSPANVILESDQYSEVWKQFIRDFRTQEVMQAMLSALAPSIRKELPDFESRFGKVEDLKMVPRKGGDQPHGTIGMDTQIAVNTPNLNPGTSVRRGHLDLRNKLFTGLLYLRDPKDDSEGAELEIQELVNPDIAFGPSLSVPDDQVRPARLVPYRNNTLVIFLNTPRSLHAVTPRSATPFPRYHVNIVAEMGEPVFEVPMLPKTGLMEKQRFGALTQKISTARVEQIPFPHIVIEDFLDEAVYREMKENLPPIADSAAPVISFGTGSASGDGDDDPSDHNRFYRRLPSLLDDPDLPLIWREFLSAAVSEETLMDYFRLFGESIRAEHPDFEERFAALDEFRSFPRDLKPTEAFDGNIGANLATITPGSGATGTRRHPHLKAPKKVLEGFLLFQSGEDQTPFGDLNFFSVPEGTTPLFGEGFQTDRDALEVAKQIPGRGNTLIMWVNTPRSIQQVDLHTVDTPHPWSFVEFLVQLPENIFDVPRVSDAGLHSLEIDPETGKPVELPTLEDGVWKPVEELNAAAGWHPLESRDDRTFRWTGPHQRSQIRLRFVLPVEEPGEPTRTKDYLLIRFEILHAVTPEAVETAGIRVNGEEIPAKPKPYEGHLILEGRIPKAIPEKSAGEMEIELRVPGARIPQNHTASEKPDTRILGLGISAVSIELPLKKVKSESQATSATDDAVEAEKASV